MNPNIERLKELTDDLTAVAAAHSDALAKEPTIARPLHQAVDEAKRKLNQITERPNSTQGYVP